MRVASVLLALVTAVQSESNRGTRLCRMRMARHTSQSPVRICTSYVAPSCPPGARHACDAPAAAASVARLPPAPWCQAGWAYADMS